MGSHWETFQRISVLDENTCSQCRKRAGKLFSRVQLEKIGAPPFHSIKDGHYSNCRCHLEQNFKKVDFSKIRGE